MLGALTALCPFSIDTYLPAFPRIAADLHIEVAELSVTLSGFFVGLAAGQLFYGPLLDRFGRKRPLYAGLILFLIGTVGCWNSHSLPALVFFRFVQGLGGCGANVEAMASVRDFFEGKECAEMFSLLILILGVSPLFAPTIGGTLAAFWGWRSIFIFLGILSALLLLVSIYWLPENHHADPSHSLPPAPSHGLTCVS